MNTEIGYQEYAEESYGIGLDEIDNFAREDCRHYHGEAKRFVQRHRQLTDEEIALYVKVLRRASLHGMNLRDSGEEILEVLL